jgi:pilus assembly protein CpaF
VGCPGRAFTEGANVLIAGDVNSGKTTLLQALLAALPADRRIVTIEDPIEIDLGRSRLEQSEARQPNLQGVGRFTQRDLLSLSLRLRSDHLIVGEVRDGAAWYMVDTMSLGHNRSVVTVHAGSPLQALPRRESLCLRAEDALSLGSVRRAIAEPVNLVVQSQRVPSVVNGQPMVRRMVMTIIELVELARPGRDEPIYRLVPLADIQDGVLQRTTAAISPTVSKRIGIEGEPASVSAVSRPEMSAEDV